ncbi:MAG: radical SAM protein [Planctomycetota bacterium]|nr:radical SAM protein [Planctomycetota bacterium]MDA1026823.1 radical SAM protein [Planctomycetota bacterium]
MNTSEPPHPPIPTVHPDSNPLDPGFQDAVVEGAARLTPEQALDLWHRMPLADLGGLADRRCRAIHGESIRTYVIDRNINYTNICTAKCTFCAFRRDQGDHDAYTLEYDELLNKIREVVAIGGTQILMQGGMNPELPLDWYLELLRRIKSEFPQVHVHAFSPPEFIEFVNFFDPPGDSLKEKIRAVMGPLVEAGLDSVPGGGGEIFADAVRRKIGLGKCTAEAWLTVMRVAHEFGLNTSATMMFGHIEGIADRIHHMDTVRRWQDDAIQELANDGGGRYHAFISWPFQPDNTPLGRLKEWGHGPGDDPSDPYPGDVVARLDGSGTKDLHPEFGRRLRFAGSTAYLRTQAMSRLYLDNIWSIGSSWVTMGPHIGQVGLRYGANDMGSVMMEENVVSAAGTTHCLNEPMICRLIRDAGFVPAQRNNNYQVLKPHFAPDGPDLAVEDWSNFRASSLHRQTDSEETGGGCETNYGTTSGDASAIVDITIKGI